MKLTPNALDILKKRYLINGESPEDMCRRVAKCASRAEFVYAPPEECGELVTQLEEDFFWIMNNQYFMPNSPTLMNAGKDFGTLSGCFVIGIEDDLSEIFDSIKKAALITKAGGGVGLSWHKLRPKNVEVRSTARVSSGPIPFLKAFDSGVDSVKQGGLRKGANMGVLPIWHPDIVEFIQCKDTEGVLTTFNLSVAITDVFMEQLEENPESYHKVYHPMLNGGEPCHIHKDGRYVSHGRSGTGQFWTVKEVFDLIVTHAWKNGEPGVVFIDSINKAHPLDEEVNSTNPCWTGDTKIWTIEGAKSFKELEGKDIPVLTQDRENRLCVKMMRNIRKTKKKANLVEVEIEDRTGNRTRFRCTPDHKLYITKGRTIEAKDLIEGMSLASVYRYNANSNGYLRLENGIESPLEHHVMVEWSCGRRPNYPKEHCHHKNGVKYDNHPDNLEILKAKEHNASNMFSENNPMSGVWDERNPLYKDSFKGKENPAYRNDIDDEQIIEMKTCGLSFAAIANELGCSKYTVQKRFHEATTGTSYRNHTVISVKYIEEKEDVYNGTVDDTHRFFVMCGENDAILSRNCGEQPLLEYESCNLGSINLAAMVVEDKDGIKQVDWELLAKVCDISTHFLENIIDVNNYPLPDIEVKTKFNRKIGAGVMGWADMLVKLGLSYHSEQALELAKEVSGFIQKQRFAKSVQLANQRGPFPGWRYSIWKDKKPGQIPRNSTLTTIAPTGSISSFANCSFGIEPYYALAYDRHVVTEANDGAYYEVNQLFLEIGNKEGWLNDAVLEYISRTGSCIGAPGIPDRWHSIFCVASDIGPEWHIRMQAAWQENTDNAVSKTINLPELATKDDVRRAYLLAYELGCKGLTVYRDGSRSKQVMVKGGTRMVKVESIFPRSRPDEVQPIISKKWNIGNCGSLYVNVHKDEIGICEVFIMGAEGGCHTLVNELARNISRMLRTGIDVQYIVDKHKGEVCTNCVTHPKANVKSCSDAIGLTIEQALTGLATPTLAIDFSPKGFIPCDECGGIMIIQEGCPKCSKCGASRCG